LWNNGRGQFQRGQSVSMPDREGYPVGIWRFEAADLNGDNRVDLFLTGCCGGGVSTGASAQLRYRSGGPGWGWQSGRFGG
jgi:hypothetical protein